MSEMMNGFVMHGIGKVGMIQKPIPLLAGSYPPRSPNWICPGHTSHLYPSHSKPYFSQEKARFLHLTLCFARASDWPMSYICSH
jgi:hypothetical protein